MFQNNREGHFQDLLADPLIQTLMNADKVDPLQLEAMLMRIAEDLKKRNETPSPTCIFARIFSSSKAG